MHRRITGRLHGRDEDVFTTAASADPMSGVEVWANSIETVLSDFPLQSANSILSLAIIIMLAMVPAALGLRLSSLLVGLSSLVLAAGFLVAAELAFAHGLILPVPEPIVALGIATGGVIAVDSYIERQQWKALEQFRQPFLKPGQYTFFLSYRRDQSSFVARQLRTALAARFGDQSVFMDETAIHPGQDWPQEIPEAIMGCQAMLVLIGKYWLAEPGAAPGSRRLDDPGDWVRREVEQGLGRDEAVVIPILTDGATMPSSAELPPSLAPLAAKQAFVLAGVNLKKEVRELATRIQRGRLAPRRGAVSQLPAGVPGLRLVRRRRRENAADTTR